MILSIIIPIYNEEKTIKELLEKVINAKLPKSVKREIIVINDGSVDNSNFKIQNLISKFPAQIKLFSHKRNLGKGAAIKTGFKQSSGEVIIIQDADLEYDPKYYTELLDPILINNAEVVYGSRLMKYPLRLWGRNKSVLLLHLVANKFLVVLTNILYGSKLTDIETGYKVFKRGILENIILNSNGFDFEVEVTAKLLKKGLKIYEIPINVVPRTYKEGKKIGWIDGIMAIWALIKYKFVN